MKKWSGFFSLVLLVFILFPTPSAIAQSYIGTFCWSVTVTEKETGPISPPDTFLSKFDVVYLGGASYALQGKALPPGDNPAILAGTAHIIGSDVYMNLSLTQTHVSEPWRDTGAMQVKLSLPGLNGTFYEVGNDFNPSTRTFGPHYSAGTVTLTSCP